MWPYLCSFLPATFSICAEHAIDAKSHPTQGIGSLSATPLKHLNLGRNQLKSLPPELGKVRSVLRAVVVCPSYMEGIRRRWSDFVQTLSASLPALTPCPSPLASSRYVYANYTLTV